MTQQANIQTLEALQTKVNSLVTTYNKLVALKDKFNAKGWDVLQSKVTFDLNRLHDLTDIIEIKYHIEKSNYNTCFFELNGYVIL
jgi:hypothetical protein